jgi:hypothetical protein
MLVHVLIVRWSNSAFVQDDLPPIVDPRNDEGHPVHVQSLVSCISLASRQVVCNSVML